MKTTEGRRLATELIAAHKAVGIHSDDLALALSDISVIGLQAGSVLYEEGAPSDELKVLARGTVSVEVGGPDNVVATVQAPAILGHLGVLTGLPRSATVRASDDVAVGTLDARALWALLDEQRPGGGAFRRLLLGSMAGLLATTNRQVATQVAQTGTPVASTPDAPPPKPAAPRARRDRLHSAGESGSWGFDSALLEAAEEVKIVQAKADRDRKYTKHS